MADHLGIASAQRGQQNECVRYGGIQFTRDTSEGFMFDSLDDSARQGPAHRSAWVVRIGVTS